MQGQALPCTFRLRRWHHGAGGPMVDKYGSGMLHTRNYDAREHPLHRTGSPWWLPRGGTDIQLVSEAVVELRHE